MKKISRCVILIVVFAAALSLASAAWAAVHEQVILTFTGVNGMWPLSPLLRDASGRLYGATLAGGPSSSQCPIGCGVVFELIPKAGGWTYRTLYAFLGGNDSSGPVGKLVFDASGNLYGAALGGGANGAGTVFKLSSGVTASLGMTLSECSSSFIMTGPCP